jgi:hypothetical protein
MNKSYLHTVTAGVTLPLLQSGVTCLVCGLVGVGLGLWFRWRSWPVVSLGLGLVGFTLSWYLLQKHWLSLTGLERLTGIDLDGNGQIGNLSPQSKALDEVRVYVSEVKPDGHITGNQSIYNFPCTSEQLVELARGLVEEGESFSERTWCGSGRPFSVGTFRELRSEFIRRGLVSLASVKDSRQGYCLTVGGRHVLAGVLAELSPSPTEAGK